jgi:flagellar FliL protein
MLPFAGSAATARSGHVMADKKTKDDKKTKPDDVDDDVDAAETTEGSQPKKRWLSRKLIIMVAAAVVVLGGGAAAALMMFGGGDEELEVAEKPKPPPVFLDVPEVLVNLNNPGSERVQYLKVKVVLELPDAAQSPQVEQAMPRVMDAFQTYLRELRPTDLDGSAGLYRLKEELTRRVNASIAPNRVNAVLFKEIVVQ